PLIGHQVLRNFTCQNLEIYTTKMASAMVAKSKRRLEYEIGKYIKILIPKINRFGVKEFPELENIPTDYISVREAARNQNTGTLTGTIRKCKGSCNTNKSRLQKTKVNKFIKRTQVECLNQNLNQQEEHIQSIFKNDDTCLESNDDAELIISIPFNQAIDLHSIKIVPKNIGHFDDAKAIRETQMLKFIQADYENNTIIPLRSALQCYKIASEFDHSNTESLAHSNDALQKLINTLLFHGESFYSLKQYDKDLLYYDKVLEIDPFNLIASSFPYFNHGHYDKAFSDLEKVLEQYDEDLYNPGMSLEIKSNYTNALILQAKICFNLEKYNDTIRFLSKALEIDPKNKIILTLRGVKQILN
ncbi:16209_t:CDS:2, partial [Gigaspora margarita]